ncbi:MAG: 6-carboxytetrahydropterin synthase [Phycisphaerales bacterium]|nr:6-carboxytetrahydropterin synthase [Phycisphaerales bacterium]
MYEIEIQARFSAAHAIRMRGQLEPLHGHDFLVTVTLAAAGLDEDGLVCDFHAVERRLREIVGRFHNRSMNDVPPFSHGLNPSAELIARHIADELAATPFPNVRVASVRVTEAPGCAAVYRPQPGGRG